MGTAESIFHLAIPCRDLDEAKEFYIDRLGCRLARRYDDRITLEFFGDQIVCHLSPNSIDPEPTMYPRHFGRTFQDRSQFDALLQLAREQGLKFFSEPFLRFEGMREEHETFFLCDPSNNLLEFKYYNDPEMMY
jgi:extradiol dioxygenase family protein